MALLSETCKRRCCIYLTYASNGCYCSKRNHGLEYEDDDDVNCEDECNDYDNDDDD